MWRYGKKQQYPGQKFQPLDVAPNGGVQCAAQDIRAQAVRVKRMEAGKDVERRRKNGQIALFADLISSYIGGLETQFATVL